MRIRSNRAVGSGPAEAARRGASARGVLRAGGLAGGKSTGPRLVRLVILLVLILVVMQQAADPAIYRNFFAALGAPLDGEGRARAAVGSAVRPSGPLGENPSGASAPLAATVEALGEAGRLRLVEWLSQRRRGVAETDPQAFETLSAMLGSAAVAAGEVPSEPLVDAIRLSSSGTAGSAGQRDELRQRLQQALDQFYLRRVSDATIWQPQDATAFYRLLEKSAEADSAAPARPEGIQIGYALLVDEPEVYRGRMVRVSGSVARLESLVAASNLSGISRYWLLWLVPDDGSQRPIMIYSAELPVELSSLAGSRLLASGPSVRAEGIFLRRHLYQSQQGSELAPVIVGTVRSLAPAGDPVAAAVPPASESEGRVLSSGERTLLVSTAVAIGVGFTLLVAWASARHSRRRRALRQRGRAGVEDFLGGLEASRPLAPGSGESASGEREPSSGPGPSS